MTIACALLLAVGVVASPSIALAGGRGAEGLRRTVAAPPAQRPSPLRDWYLELDTWLSAVDRHEPGKADSAAETIASWDTVRLARMLGDVVELRKRMKVYALQNDVEIRLRLRRLQPRDVEDLFRISEEERVAGNIDRVIRRGAVLHADIAMFARDLPAPPANVPDIMVRVHDGRQSAVDQGTTLHWRFGREVVAALQPGPDTGPFVRAWYLATTAHMQQERMLTLTDEHLSQARRVMPDDPAVLFAGACALETLASRRVQTEMSELNLPAGYRFESRGVGALEDEALALFRKVLALDPQRPEARIRMARLIALRGNHDEASPELARAAAAGLEGPLAYMAWLFTGDEELALGRRATAEAAYERAASLFPDAPSPIVALARLARESGDSRGVTATLERWWALPRGGQDPWRDFYFMQGGDVEERMQEVHRLAGGRRR